MNFADITIRQSQGPARAPRSAAIETSGRHNQVLAIVLVGLVALAPIPLGSNRPFFWGLIALLVGLCGAAYAAYLALTESKLRFGLDRMRLPLVLLGLLLGYQVLQILPLGALFGGFSFKTFFGSQITSATLSLAPGATWLAFLRFLTYGIFLLLMLQVAANRQRARTLASALFFIITAHAAFGLASLTVLGDTLLFVEKWAYFGSATGTFVNRNSFATFLAFGVVLGIGQVVHQWGAEDDPGGRRARTGHRWQVTLTYGVCLLLIFAALFASNSRMGLFVAGAGSVVLLVLALVKLPRRGRWGIVGLLTLFALGALTLLFGGGLIERLGSVERDANVRSDLYAQALDMILARPLLGYGGGAFELAFPLFHRPPVSLDMFWDKAHNTYLSLWVDYGFVIGSIPVLILLLIGLDAFKVYRRRERDWIAPAVTIGVLVVAATHSLIDFSLEIEANALMLLAIVALGVARSDRSSRAAKAGSGEGSIAIEPRQAR